MDRIQLAQYRDQQRAYNFSVVTNKLISHIWEPTEVKKNNSTSEMHVTAHLKTHLLVLPSYVEPSCEFVVFWKLVYYYYRLPLGKY